MTVQHPIKNVWHYVLHTLFEKPAVVLIGGNWKTRKTDMALLIAEICLKRPSWFNPQHRTLVTEVASNIDTLGAFPMITDLISLRQWLFESSKCKLFLFDEANVHLPSRRAMSGKNVAVVQLLAEISKAHARMIVIGQNLLSFDKEFLNDVWCRGIFIKQNL